ncbi:RING-H2 finger protein ATL33-like [Neltuma alba]|uniref:RING-H2 finger protein ATL33-like n=1 Tax=Neltuma alba TaxID=207710 RepID=UPI0010A50DDC|nr:RING-H2 finger protein ATL33-like [Prosopis alba]
MENAPPPLITTPPPFPPPQPPPPSSFFPFPPPPRAFSQITVINALPPPPPQPPFPDSSSSVDLSPLEFLLALIAVVTIPALIYTFIFAVKCPSRHRRHPDETSGGPPSVVSEPVSHDGGEAAAVVSDVKYQKDAHVKEIGSECPVCLSVFSEGEEVRQLSVCKHSFHASCIDMWLSNHSNCPICRATVTVKRPNTAAPPRNNADLQQGLPDASSLV